MAQDPPIQAGPFEVVAAGRAGPHHGGKVARAAVAAVAAERPVAVAVGQLVHWPLQPFASLRLAVSRQPDLLL